MTRVVCCMAIMVMEIRYRSRHLIFFVFVHRVQQHKNVGENFSLPPHRQFFPARPERAIEEGVLTIIPFCGNLFRSAIIMITTRKFLMVSSSSCSQHDRKLLTLESKAFRCRINIENKFSGSFLLAGLQSSNTTRFIRKHIKEFSSLDYQNIFRS